MTIVYLARIAYGSTFLIAPGAVLPRESESVLRTIARVLGARELVQAALVRPGSSPRRFYLGAFVDGSHAATMAACAAISPAHRRVAGRNALTALGFAVAGIRQARRAS